MKNTELRIGNYVNAFGTNPGIVDELYKTHLYIKWTDSTVTYSYDELKPIPLTEDWLKKFGFKKSIYSTKEDTHWNNGEKAIKQRNGIIYLCDVEIKYIHQLQNLYFALTGKEMAKIIKKLNH